MLENSQTSYSFSLEETLFAVKLLRNEINIDYVLAADDSFARFVQHHGLTAHLYNNSFNPSLQGALRKLLKNQYFAVTIRNSQLFETYRVISQQFDANNIKYVPLKGSFLLPVFYKDLAGRGMSDVDILIHANDYKAARELLHNLGATQEIELESEFLQDLGHHFPPFWLYNTSIEIHNRILPANVRYNIPANDVWANLDHYHVDGLEIMGMNIYLLICYLSLHIYYSEMRGEYRIYWYLDISKIIESTIDFNPDNLRKWFLTYRIEKPVSEVLAKVSFLFNIPIESITPMSEASINIFQHNLSRHNSIASKGYSIAFERILYTKGLFNKVRYVIHTIRFGETENQINFIQRVSKISGRLVSYLYYSALSGFKR